MVFSDICKLQFADGKYKKRQFDSTQPINIINHKLGFISLMNIANDFSFVTESFSN